MIKQKFVADSLTVMTEMIMPNDTNPLGNLMGGNLMRWMDICGGICAGKHAEAHVVTVSVDNVSFDHPINLGNVITLTACVTRAFRTSIEVYVEVSVADITGANVKKSNHAFFTFVALDEKTRKPIKSHQLQPITREEQNRYDSATRRRELRLILGGKLEPHDAEKMKELFFPS